MSSMENKSKMVDEARELLLIKIYIKNVFQSVLKGIHNHMRFQTEHPIYLCATYCIFVY